MVLFMICRFALCRFALCLLLCCLFAVGAKADPITYQQVQQSRGQQVATARASHSDDSSASSSQTQGETAPPEFVRLPDGRIVPYGAGVICTENCAEPFAAIAPPAASRLWFAAPPALVSSLVCGVLCGGDSKLTLSAELEPTPTPTGTPAATPIPEPATLILLGLGLAVIGRRRLLDKIVQH